MLLFYCMFAATPLALLTLKQQQIRSARGRGITTLKKPRFKEKREAEKEKQKR